MSDQGCVIHVNAGQVPAEDDLKKIMAKYPASFGLAILEDGSLNTISERDLPFEKVMEYFELCKDDHVAAHFGATGIHDEDVQPFVVLSDPNNEALMVGFCDGDYTGFFKKESAHGLNFFFMNQLVIPKISAMFKLTGGNIDTLMSGLLEPVIQEEFKTYSSRGVLTLMARNGKSPTYAHDDRKMHPWGWASEDFSDFKENEEEASEAEEAAAEEIKKTPKKVSKLAKGKPKPAATEKKYVSAVEDEDEDQEAAALAEAAQDQVEKPKKDAPVAQPAKAGTSGPKPSSTAASPPEVKVEYETVTIDVPDMSNKKLYKWFSDTLGGSDKVPSNYKDLRRLTIQRPKKTTVKSFADAAKVVAGREALAPNADGVKTEARGDGSTVETFTTPSGTVVRETVSATMPIISVQQKEAAKQWMTAPNVAKQIEFLRDGNIPTLDQIKSMFQKVPTFEENLGVPKEHAWRMPFEVLVNFIRTFPQLGALLIIDLGVALEEASAAKPKAATAPAKTSKLPKAAAAGGGKRYVSAVDEEE